jgi:hypothetical protein
VLLTHLQRGNILPEKRGLFSSDAQITDETLFKWLCISVGGFDAILRQHNMQLDKIAPNFRLRSGKIFNWV